MNACTASFEESLPAGLGGSRVPREHGLAVPRLKVV
jgi:hypothetical protein